MDTLGGNTNATDKNSHGKQPAAEANEEPIPSIQPTSWLDLLPEEVLGKVASFLPSKPNLDVFSSLSEGMINWAASSKFAEDAFGDVYLNSFHGSCQGCITNNHQLVPGRQLWQDMTDLCHSLQPETHWRSARRALRRSTEESRRPPPIRVQQPLLNRVEILPQVEEDQALLYDNWHIDPTEYFDIQPQEPTRTGYFGLRPLTLAGDALTADTTPVAVWGDFNGLFVAPTWDALVNPYSKDRDRLFHILDFDNDPTQVMDLMIHPQWSDAPGGISPFFLAFASGVVKAFTRTKDGNYETLAMSERHAGEVTSLTIVPSSKWGHLGYLVSACSEGEVYLYPESLTNLDLDQRIRLNPAHIPNFPIFGISATRFQPNEAVLCLGGDGLKVHLWKIGFTTTGESHRCHVIENHEFEYHPRETRDRAGQVEHQTPEAQEVQEAQRGEHKLTCVSFVGPIVTAADQSSSTSVKKDLLVTGTNRGHIVTWDLLQDNDHAPKLQIRKSHKEVHNGCIESTERVGNMLLTAGGSDGLIKTMDLETGTPKVNLMVHPGTRLVPYAGRAGQILSLEGGVVTSYVCHERQSLISFCRDGHISECTFQLEHKPPLPPPSNASGTKKKKAIKSGRKRQDFTIITASSKIAPPTVQVVQELMKDMPPNEKALFNQLAFCDLNHLHRPVLVLSPLDVPPGRALNDWVRQMKAGGKCPRLVHWLGCPDSERAYAAKPISKMTSYSTGVKKGYKKVPDRCKNKPNLERYEKEFVEGLKLLPIEEAKDPGDRGHPAKKPRSPSDPVQDSVGDDDPRPINTVQTRTPSPTIPLEDSASLEDLQEVIGVPGSLQSDQPVRLKSPSLASNQVSLQSQEAKRSIPTPTSPSSPRPRKRRANQQ